MIFFPRFCFAGVGEGAGTLARLIFEVVDFYDLYRRGSFDLSLSNSFFLEKLVGQDFDFWVAIILHLTFEGSPEIVVEALVLFESGILVTAGFIIEFVFAAWSFSKVVWFLGSFLCCALFYAILLDPRAKDAAKA